MAEESATAEKTQQEQAPQGDASKADSKTQVSAQKVDLEEATPGQTGGADSTGRLDIILDMNVPVTVTIGQTQVPVRKLLQLGPGSVLKLDKPVDMPADLFLKDIRFGTADVVVVDGRFAVRIKQIIGAGNDDKAEEQKSDDK
jgi:flagellar motor switch protein FliN/FliY